MYVDAPIKTIKKPLLHHIYGHLITTCADLAGFANFRLGDKGTWGVPISSLSSGSRFSPFSLADAAAAGLFSASVEHLVG